MSRWLCQAIGLGTCFVLALGCDEERTALEVERLPEVEPNLPEVPKLPPPSHPVQYEDGSYSVYGLRKRIEKAIDTDVEVTAVIVDLYEPPECPAGETCPPPAAPHVWVADEADETEAAKRLTVVGYAENQDEVDKAIRDAKRGRPQRPDPDTGLPPIPTDFAVGNKIKLKGRFTRISASGFNASDGLIEYQGHETLSTAPDS